jgi:hypothetical protein
LGRCRRCRRGSRDVIVVNFPWLITHAEQAVAVTLVGKAEVLVATMSQYFFAPLTADQLKVGPVETPVAPLEGCDRAGAGSRL